MKRRLRKKRNLGEFAIYGVSLRICLQPDLTTDARSNFLDDFIERPIESQNLRFGGGGSVDWRGVVQPVLPERSIPEASIRGLRDWLTDRSGVAFFEVSELWDLNHGFNPFENT